MTAGCIGLLGARSLVGERILSLNANTNSHVVAFSRQTAPVAEETIEWRRLESGVQVIGNEEAIPCWISVAPIWVLPQYFSLLEGHGIRRIVALSSTSRFTKIDSSEATEQEVAKNLEDGEDLLRNWAETNGVQWVILRPTLIYGYGQDKNVSEICKTIRRLRFFPLVGGANGLRQPVHADDIAAACLAACRQSQYSNKAYNLSGGETLSYREMVSRIFLALGYTPRYLTIPFTLFSLAIRIARIVPRFSALTPGMAVRMNQDLLFDHGEAELELGFRPRPFSPTAEDLPK